MMKVIFEEDVYCFPEKYKINFLSENKHQETFIKCLSEYFGRKKKNFCKVIDNEGNRILYDELQFIYFPYLKTNIDQNIQFASKSFFNSEISKIIDNNPEKFQSVDHIRESLHELLTDHGMYQLRKILSAKINHTIEFQIDNFDIGKLLEMISIKNEGLTELREYLMLYNLMIFLNRDKNCIVYIDLPINDEVIQWMKGYLKEDILFLVLNNISDPSFSLDTDSSFIVLSDVDYMEAYHFDLDEFNLISYVMNRFVQANLRFQSEKIMEYGKQFLDEKTTFYLMFEQRHPEITDK